MENYYEQQLLDEGSNAKAQTKYFILGGTGIAFFLIAAVILISAFNQQLWALLIFTVIIGGAGIYLFIKKDEAFIEFEYVYSAGDLEVAKIINNNKRKELAKVSCAEIEVFGKTSAPCFVRYETMPDAKKAYATFVKKGNEDAYFAVFVGKKGKVVLVFEPDDEMLSNIKKYLRVPIEK